MLGGSGTTTGISNWTGTGPNRDGIHDRTGCAIRGGNDLEKAEKFLFSG